jgi:tRNA dimethylallyltransferase
MEKLLFIIGQTASGKKSLSHLAAVRTGPEIISVDSMKIYRYMDIGTAKPSQQKREEVAYHMIDVKDPHEEVDLKWFIESVDRILGSGGSTRFILSGGSSMYIRGILSGVFEGPARDSEFRKECRERAAQNGVESLHAELAKADPQAAAQIHSNDLKRIIRALEVFYKTGEQLSELQTQFNERRTGYDFCVAALRYPREVLYERINQRVDKMFEQGLVLEVEQMYAENQFGSTSSKAIGYAEIIHALEQGTDPSSDEVKDEIKKNTRRFARKQMTWFKKFEQVIWLDVEEGMKVEDQYTMLVPLLEECGYLT